MQKRINECETELWDIETAITNSGSYGILQIFVSFVLSLFLLLSAYQSTVLYYVANDPPWTCVTNTSSQFCKHHYGKVIEQSNPHFSQRCNLNSSEWRFTKDESFSLVTEYNLICENNAIAAVTNSGFFIGWGVAGLFMGYLTDIYGRKVILCIAMLLLSSGEILSSFISSVWQIILLRILIGAGYGTVNTTAFTLTTEVVGAKHRVLAASIYYIPNDWSMLACTLLAYYVQHWRKLLFYTSLPSILLLILFIFLPESVRWLYATNKYDKAEILIKRIAKINRKKLPPFKLLQVQNIEAKERYSYTDLLFCHKKVFVLVFASCFAWMANGLIYYGYTLESSDLGGSIYVNFALSCIVDLPTGLVAYFTCKWFGRKKSCMAFILFAGLTLVGLSIASSLPINDKYSSKIKLSFAMIGKGCISYSFAVLYLWTFELYPTIVRSQGMTLCQIAGRIGSATAPFIATTLSEIFQPMPFILMAAIAVITLLLLFIVPETKSLKTRERFEDFFNNANENISIKDNIDELPSDCENLLTDTD